MAQAAVTEFPGTPGDFLRYARQLAKLEQKDVAEHMECDPKTVSRWEHNVYLPRIDEWVDLAQFLHAPWLIEAVAGWMRGGDHLREYAATPLRVAAGPQRFAALWQPGKSTARLCPVKGTSSNGPLR